MYIRTMIVLAVLMFPALASGASPKKMCDNFIAPIVQSAVGENCVSAAEKVELGCQVAAAGMVLAMPEMSAEIEAMCIAADATVLVNCGGATDRYPQSKAEPDMNALCAAFPE
jgi:hypothetical protein